MSIYLNTLIRNTRRIIERWHGRRATMLELTKGHKTLSIIVGNDTYGENLLISCVGPQHICGPIEWDDSQLVFKTALFESGEEGVTLLDECASVQVLCESFEVAENVKL